MIQSHNGHDNQIDNPSSTNPFTDFLGSGALATDEGRRKILKGGAAAAVTNFPAEQDGVTVPRDCTIVIRRKNGGIIGS